MLKLQTLSKGDYLIGEHLLIQRKTKDDFTLSIIKNRLFAQCRKIKNSEYNCLLLIEGNPYQSTHNISRKAVKRRYTLRY
ncbi:MULTISPECIES: ERCC4 domain-containing protein [unclassified Carboxylicivirga]|uniref:ERCC4 domain-containing protein n=1 Tax=Carboxylicivirga TaxID=1628153 RepID=UPI003D3437B2